MLVTFSCKAHENITMFGDVAHRLIKMMGHSGEIPSAILAKDVPEALARLRESLEADPKKQFSQAVNEADDENDAPVSLTHRAKPLIDLLNDAIRAKCNVLWKSNAS